MIYRSIRSLLTLIANYSMSEHINTSINVDQNVLKESISLKLLCGVYIYDEVMK